jgi:hypothetical protein
MAMVKSRNTLFKTNSLSSRASEDGEGPHPQRECHTKDDSVIDNDYVRSLSVFAASG